MFSCVRVNCGGPVCGTWAKAQGEGGSKEQAKPKVMEEYQRGGRGEGQRGGHRKEQGPKVRIQESETARDLSSCLGRLLVFAVWMCGTMLGWVCIKGSGRRGHTRGKSLYSVS